METTIDRSGALVAADVGNTTIAFARFRRGGWGSVRRHEASDPVGAARAIAALARSGNLPVFFGSVRPGASRRMAQALRRAGLRVRDIRPALARLVPCRLRPGSRAGTDRLLNALAVKARSRRGAVVVDFGTAVTLDVVSPEGVFLGGAIAPGIRLSLASLAERTALLPRLSPGIPRRVLGRSTADAMRSGVVRGLAAAVEGLVKGLRRELPFRPMVLSTGGDAQLLSRICPSIEQVVPILTLEGIRIAATCRRTSSSGRGSRAGARTSRAPGRASRSGRGARSRSRRSSSLSRSP